MREEWALLGLGTLSAGAVLLFWIVEAARHRARLRRVSIRVHVNGIRGKSTIVRYIAAALREGGIETIAKTTGSATRLIDRDGTEHPIVRPGAPTILEQIRVLRDSLRPTTCAIVFECMALRPAYQWAAEHRIIHSTAGVIVNVRRDHIEQLGSTLPEIAESLSNTAPRRAPLFTAEERPELRDILGRAAEANGGRLVPVSGGDIDERDLHGFDLLAFRRNIALALAVAEHFGVARAVALRGMRKAAADPGASRIHRHALGGRTIYWVDLFGVNDVSSAEDNIRRVQRRLGRGTATVFLLNNRHDRQNRTREFAGMVARDQNHAGTILIGEDQRVFRDEIDAHGGRTDTIRMTGEDAAPRLDELSRAIGELTDARVVALFGLANVHSEGADALRPVLESEETALDPGRDAERAEDAERPAAA